MSRTKRGKGWVVILPCGCCWGRFEHRVKGPGRYPFYCPECRESGAVDRLMRGKRRAGSGAD